MSLLGQYAVDLAANLRVSIVGNTNTTCLCDLFQPRCDIDTVFEGGKDIRVFEARVLAHGKATPLQPVLELLRDYFGLRTKKRQLSHVVTIRAGGECFHFRHRILASA
jgi:hypothetical protein